MDFRDTAAEAAFRAEVRGWFDGNLPADWLSRSPGQRRQDVEATRAWSRALHDAGYVGLTWPEDSGGRGLDHTYQGIFLEESARAEAPSHLGVIGLSMAGPTIIAWGTTDQKRRYLPPLMRAEEIWCQGFSEPGNGSDLAGIRTAAVLDGDTWVVNGQKVWSSFAHIADFCLLLVRTEHADDAHRGLSYLIVDMKGEGIEVRPLKQMTGDSDFNEIFFTDVRVPRESMLGGRGEGWKVAMTTLLHERGTLGFALTANLEQAFIQVRRLAQESGAAEDPLVRDQLAQFWIDIRALRYTNYRSLAALRKTGVPGPEGSIAKLFWSERNQELTKFAQQVNGQNGLAGDPNSAEQNYWALTQLRSRANTIEAGTSEILRNIIAERVIGLPRSR